MDENQAAYAHLHNLSRTTRILQGISHILDWDQETYMPPGASGIRGEQLKTLAGIIHKQKTGAPYTNALQKLIDIKTGKIHGKHLTDAQKASLREWWRDYVIEKALPKKFVEDFAQLTSQAMHAWRHAKEQDAFQQFAPYLDRIVQMMRKKADLIGYKKHPYDALMDLYEPGMTVADVDPLFAHLRTDVVKLLKHISSKKPVDDSFLFGNFPVDQQMKFGNFLLDALGYDRNKGRLDTSAHPFSSACHPTDSRITTKIHSSSLMSNIGAVLHEAGHAMYEMGLPAEQYGSPLGESISLGVHESQSRWWETRIGHSKAFWHYFLPKLKEHFTGKLDQVTLDNFYQAINKVKPSFIRIEADEVTYSLHVILRYELEKALIAGSLSVRDVPDAWNAKMKELLGIVPTTHREGCLQDIHWSMGGIGYFPTYTLGNLYAGHLFETFEKDHPDWEQRLANGELVFVKDWLHQAVWQHGRHYNSKELLQRVTKKPFSAHAYASYLSRKYGK